LLRPDRRIHDYRLLIGSADSPGLGFSETLTLDPLTKRFQKYRVPSEEFGSRLMQTAFGSSSKITTAASSWDLAKGGLEYRSTRE
jgi:hypothetical protein